MLCYAMLCYAMLCKILRTFYALENVGKPLPTRKTQDMLCSTRQTQTCTPAQALESSHPRPKSPPRRTESPKSRKNTPTAPPAPPKQTIHKTWLKCGSSAKCAPHRGKEAHFGQRVCLQKPMENARARFLQHLSRITRFYKRAVSNNAKCVVKVWVQSKVCAPPRK